MSRAKQDWRLVEDVPGLAARREWHGGLSFAAICPQCFRWLEGPSLEELAGRVCKCGWQAHLPVIAFLVEVEEYDAWGE